jgi:lipoprotein-releasing system ATP-binding protein
MLNAYNIGKTYPTRAQPLIVLQGVNLSLQAGQSAAIMGPSGSGKSTLLNILGTLDSPTSGNISLNDPQTNAPINPFEMHEKQLARFRNRRIGFIFQDHHLLPQCSALENVLMPTLADPENAATDRVPKAIEHLERVGLSERLQHTPAELSGGERQRVAIARALINQPQLLLADEPTGNLDESAAANIAEILSDIYKEQNSSLIVVTHSHELANKFDIQWKITNKTLIQA